MKEPISAHKVAVSTMDLGKLGANQEAGELRKVDYQLLLAQAHELVKESLDPTANLANISALLADQLADTNWVGFYLCDFSRNSLVLGPFQGKPATVYIEKGKGVCGTAWATGVSQRVEDVHSFPGHIACDSSSNSELVIPIFRENLCIGVLDLDSPLKGRFSPEDQIGLESIARFIGGRVLQ